MARRLVVGLFAALALVGGFLMEVSRHESGERVISSVPRTRSLEGERHEAKSDQPDKALLWYFEQRAYPAGHIPLDWKERALAHIRANDLTDRPGTHPVLVWTNVGPNNIGGRTRAVAIHPTNNNIIYCGSVSGGVWRSTDAGASWSATNDFADNLAISSIVIDPSNANVIYAGTGEGFFNIDAVRGAGILKSVDGGAMWTVQTNFTGIPSGTSFPYYVNDIQIRPDSTNVLYAATNSGLYKTVNGGQTWFFVKRGDASIRATQIVLAPNNPKTLYVAFGNFSKDGIYRSTDGGTSFTKLAGGFPTAGFHRIAMAISRSNANFLYACTSDSATYQTHGIYKTTNGGSTWTAKAIPQDPELGGGQTHLGGQGWYNNVLAVHPSSENTVYAGGVNLFRSTNGGTSWTRISDGYAPFADPYVHVDHHAIVFDPTNSSVMYFGNDGGMFKTTDGGNSFIEINAGLVTAQFYSGAVHPSSDIYYGGTQDNGTLRSGTLPNWSMAFGGDGGATAVDFNNPSTVYTEYVSLSFQKSTNGGTSWFRAMSGIPTAGPNQGDGTSDRVQFIAPFTMDPTNPQRILAGTYKIYQTTSAAASWSTVGTGGDLTGDGTGQTGSTITTIAIAKSAPTTVYVGTSGSASTASRIMVTTNNGTSWTNATSAPLPNRFVTAIAIDPTNADRAIVCYSGYGVNTGSTPGHVFLTVNRGGSWTDVSGNLPDIPVNAAVIDPMDATHFIVGTDLGVFESVNNGLSWSQQNMGLANVVIADLDLRSDRILFAATHGRGMAKTPLAVPMAVDTVYPGDANGDGIVDVRDLLPLGRYYGLTGPARFSPSLNWTPQYLTSLWSPPDAADADGNGNGRVDSADVRGIVTNWYQSRTITSVPGRDPIEVVDELLRAIGPGPLSEPMHAIRRELLRFRSEILGVGPDWRLEQNYPNPFNPSTTIRYNVPNEVTELSISIIDVAGRALRAVRAHDVLPGVYTFVWDGRTDDGTPVASGVYLFTLRTENVQLTRKMILIK
jgi:photosystem II stability/assembly factor-like uncharacterized protein